MKRLRLGRRLLSLKLLICLLLSLSTTTCVLAGGTEPLPQRVVSTSLASDEILLEVLPRSEWSRVAAISPLARNPQYSHLSPEQIGDIAVYDNAIESFVSMRADLVILASFNKPAVIDHVKRRKIRHILLKDFDSLADVKRNIIKVATVVGQRKRGRELVRDFSAAITELSRPVSDKSPRVLSIDPGFMTMGKETLLHDLIETAGGKNQAALWGISRWQKISQEKILAEDPDLIIVGYKTADPAKETDWLHRSALGGLRKPNLKRRICMVPSNSLLSTSHHILSALKKISSCVNLWKK